MAYLFEVSYRSETERKRLEYLLSKWGDKVMRPSGYVFKVEEEIFDELVSEIGAKFPSESVSVHKLIEEKVETPVNTRIVRITIPKAANEVKPFLSYLISKRRGVLSRTLGSMEMYEIYTRKGRVDLSLTLSGDANCRLDLSLRGSKEAVDLLAQEFGEELRIFGGAYQE